MGAISTRNWLDAQNGVIGSALISPELVPKILAQVSDSDFSGPALAVLQAMRHLFAAGSPVDVMTVHDAVREKLGEETAKYLIDLMNITPTAKNWQSYVDLCRKQARIVKLQELGTMLAVADTPEEQQKLIEQIAVVNSTRQGIKAIPFQAALTSFIERHSEEAHPPYMEWPFKQLNNLLFVEKGDLVLLGGRPSAGKTAFALQCAWSLSKTLRVGFFSLETQEKKLTDRQVASICDVPLENVKQNAMNQKHWDSVIALAQSDDAKRNFEVITEAGLTVSDIQAFSVARQYDVIFIDYIQLIKSSGFNRTEQVTNLSLDLHRFSQSAGCTVIGLSQLSRQGKSNGDNDSAPDMSALRESGQLEQDADVILMLYLKDQNSPNGQRVLKCAKNKEGERFRMLLDFDGKTQYFSKPGTKRKEPEEQLALLPDDTPVPAFDT